MFDNTLLIPDAPLAHYANDLLIHHPKTPYHQQVIQLVECTAPPQQRRIGSAIDSSSASSSHSSDFDGQYSESAMSEDDDEYDEDEEEEEACSSYCSSAEDDEPQSPSLEDTITADAALETYSVRIKRILAWRENFASDMSAALSEPSLPTLKRKLFDDDCESVSVSDNASHTSKRSRSASSCASSSIASLAHSCPACDASFATAQSLRQHGRDAGEACAVAVEYAFE